MRLRRTTSLAKRRGNKARAKCCAAVLRAPWPMQASSPRRCRRSSAATSTTRSSPRALPPAHWACPWWGFTGPVRRSWKGWYWPRRLSAVAICRTRSARHPATSARQNASSASPWRWARSARPRRSGRPRRRAACCSRRGSGQACASRPAHWGAS